MSDRKLDIIKDYKEDKLVFHGQQECGEILAANKIERDNPVPDLKFGRKFASVPMEVLDAWILHENLDYRKIGKDPEMRKRFMAKLNSRDWCGFKTNTGNL